MEFKHTPGPWNACHDGKCSCGMVYPNYRHGDYAIVQALSTCRLNEGSNLGEGVMNTSDEFRANARLIAAAPELLEAAHKTLILLEHLDVHKGAQEDLRLAIKKATL